MKGLRSRADKLGGYVAGPTNSVTKSYHTG